jgi:hypothetical protein
MHYNPSNTRTLTRKGKACVFCSFSCLDSFKHFDVEGSDNTKDLALRSLLSPLHIFAPKMSYTV